MRNPDIFLTVSAAHPHMGKIPNGCREIFPRQEVTANDARFTSKARLFMEEARKTALAIHAGEVLETEYAIESDGSIS